MKQMRKKAHLEEKYLVFGGFCPKIWKKSNFSARFAALKSLSCWIWLKKGYYNNPLLLGHSEEYSTMSQTGSFGRWMTSASSSLTPGDRRRRRMRSVSWWLPRPASTLGRRLQSWRSWSSWMKWTSMSQDVSSYLRIPSTAQGKWNDKYVLREWL